MARPQFFEQGARLARVEGPLRIPGIQASRQLEVRLGGFVRNAQTLTL
jgi:hypothetical protein